MSSKRPVRHLLLVWGIFSLAIAGFSAYDATRARPTDGAHWVLGGEQIRVAGIVSGGPAAEARLQAGDIIEAIDSQPIRDPRHAAEMFQSHSVGDSITYLVRRDGQIYFPTVVLGSTRLTDLRTYLVYCSLGLIYFLAGAWMVWRDDHLVATRLFFFLGSLFLITFFSGSRISAIYYWGDLFLRNVGSFASLMVAPLFLHFFLVFPERRRILDRRSWVLPAIYALPLAFYVQFSFEQLFGMSDVTIGTVQQITLGVFFAAGLASLVSAYTSSSDPGLRPHAGFLTLGCVLGTLPFLVLNITLGNLFGRADLALLGAVPMVLVPVSTCDFFRRWRLVDA